MKLDYFQKGSPGPPWPRHLFRTISIGETGLVLGAGTGLARMDKSSRRLALDADHERLLALLSITYRRPVSPATLEPIEAAATYWGRGEKALAAFRLSDANLPPLAPPNDTYRLGLAETLLDQGLSPAELMRELGLDASALDLGKYNPDQPRVPAGNGRESGRWGPGGGSGTDNAPTSHFACTRARAGRGKPSQPSRTEPPDFRRRA